MPELRAKISADPSQFYSGMSRASAFADKTGKEIARKFNNAFGVGMLAGLATSKLTQIFTKPLETAKQIDEGAKRLKVTVEEYQMLDAAAEDAGLSIDEFVASITSSNTPLEKAIQMIEQYRSQIQFLQDDIDVLTGKGSEGFAADMNALWVGASRGLTDLIAKFLVSREIPALEAWKAVDEFGNQQTLVPGAPSASP